MTEERFEAEDENGWDCGLMYPSLFSDRTSLLVSFSPTRGDEVLGGLDRSESDMLIKLSICASHNAVPTLTQDDSSSQITALELTMSRASQLVLSIFDFSVFTAVDDDFATAARTRLTCGAAVIDQRLRRIIDPDHEHHVLRWP